MTGTLVAGGEVADLLAWSGLPSAGRPVFVGGCSRSGTTLLGAMLGVGADRLTVPEAEFKWGLWAAGAVASARRTDGVVDMTAARHFLARDRMFQLWPVDLPATAPDHVSFRSLLDYLAAAFGAAMKPGGTRVWIDHTPGNIRYALTLRRAFPEARFINLVRDGRAVAASVLPLDWGANDAAEAGVHWATQIAAGLALEKRLGSETVRTVRFEDLVRDPGETLRDLCAFIDIDYNEQMVHTRDYKVHPYEAGQQALVAKPPDPSRADAWRHQLTTLQISEFERQTGELLEYLGYETQFGPAAGTPPKVERVRMRTVSAARRLVVNKLRFRLRRARSRAI